MMKSEHILLKILIIIVCLMYIGANVYFDIPQRVNEYFHNSLNKDHLALDLDEVYTLKLKKPEDYQVSSDNPSVAKISEALKVTPEKAGDTEVHVKTKKQDLTCKVTVSKKAVNPRVIYMTPHHTYRLKKPAASMTYASSDSAIRIKRGKIRALKAGRAMITSQAGHKTFENEVVCSDIMKHMNSSSVTVYDASAHKMLLNKNSDVRMNPASITKILSVYTFLQKISNVNAKATLTSGDITSAIQSGAVVTGMAPSESITYNDLLHGALLVSGADAIKAMERSLYGNTASLAAAMNANAQKFGMQNSHFTNGVGMTDPNLYTTGRDLTKLMRRAIKNKRFRKVFYTKSYKTSDSLHTFHSPSRSYGRHVLGAKNGLTDAAAECVALDEKIHGHHIYIITMHAMTSGQRKQDVVKINKYLPFMV